MRAHIRLLTQSKEHLINNITIKGNYWIKVIDNKVPGHLIVEVSSHQIPDSVLALVGFIATNKIYEGLNDNEFKLVLVMNDEIYGFESSSVYDSLKDLF